MSTPTMAPPSDTGRCGTPAGDTRHRRAGERPCDACRQSRRGAQRTYRAACTQTRQQFLVTRDDREAARLALPLTSGRLACTTTPHDFRRGLGSGMSTQCAECWGFRDDVRHPVVGGPVVGR